MPNFFKARTIPFAIKDKVEAEINRLKFLGVISPVEYSCWATPIVPIFKKNGDIRICGDFKVTLNPVIEVDQHPMPTIEQLFSRLHGGGEYSKLDLSQAFQQIEVDDDSKDLLTISTHLGLFRYNRLTFGVACAPAKFQKIMDSLFVSIKGVAVFQDDILITGKNKSEHFKNLQTVLSILQRVGLKVNYKKCIFFKESIEYLGFIIDKNGLHPSNKKTQIIDDAPRPQNVKQLQSFLGSINYYGRFVKNMSTMLNPLYNLLKLNAKWTWNDLCDQAFENIKKTLKSDNVLVHYNLDLELRLTTDASSVGIGAILSHKFPTGEDKPIAFASRTLSEAEQKYSQIEKEALSIIYGVLKFYQYLYGNKFKLITDHKPLVSIFGHNKAIPQFAANRLRRWALILSNFNYEIEFINSKNNKADWLSRMPSKSENDFLNADKLDVDYCYFFSSCSDFKINFDNVQKASISDNIFIKIKNFIKKGWPVKNKDLELQPYYVKRFDFYIRDDCLYWNHRLVIPTVLRNEVLKELHSSHMEVVRMKNFARGYIWFPNLDKEIENIVQNCQNCIFHSNAPARAEISPWPVPSGPWERLHIDFCELDRRFYLVVVDAYSKWIEIFEMSNINAVSTINEHGALTCKRSTHL